MGELDAPRECELCVFSMCMQKVQITFAMCNASNDGGLFSMFYSLLSLLFDRLCAASVCVFTVHRQLDEMIPLLASLPFNAPPK